ncbi:MAG: hypothetical protein AAF391_08315, partial [Bacteroidota bacterium]
MSFIQLLETSDKAKFRQASALLRRADIRFEILYEYRLYKENVQDPFSVGGAIIRVPRSVFHDANRLLIEHNLLGTRDESADQFSFSKKLDQAFGRIPFIDRLPLYLKLLIPLLLVGVLLFILVRLGYDNSFLDLKSTHNHFRIKHIHFEGQEMKPNTVYPTELKGFGNLESVSFQSYRNEVHLPGFNSEGVNAKWAIKEEENALTIYDADKHKAIYEGTYQIKS